MIGISVFSSNLLLSDTNLTLSASSWWYVLLSVIAIAGAYFVYRFTLPPVSRSKRSALWVIRGAALILILFMLFEPVFVYLQHRNELPAVAVLVDKSASMNVKDGTNDRVSETKKLLSSSALRRLGERTKLHYIAFADSAYEVSTDSLQGLSYNGVGTDHAGAFMRTEDQLSDQNLAAMIVVTDGSQNLGPNPLRIAKESTVPIFSIGVGDTNERVDAAISEIFTNEMTYVGNNVPVDIRIHTHGLQGKTSTLHLQAGGREVSKQNISFVEDDREVSVSMSFLAEIAGDLRVRAILDSVAGESILENNSRSVIVRVLEAKAKVLFFSGPPSADLTSLRQTLDADTTYETQVFTEAGNGKLLQGKSLPQDDIIEKSNLIVLIDFPSRATPQDLVDRICRIAESKHIPILYFAGPEVMQSRFGWLASIVPVQMQKPTLVENKVTLRAAANHPAIAGRSPLTADWPELPPVYGTIGGFTTSAGAQTVVKISRESLGITEDEPGIVFWQRGQMRGAAFLCWGIHRWKLEMANSTNSSGFYNDLVTRVCAWLIAPADQQRVKIQTTKKLYSGNEKVRFIAQVYGADLTPRDDAVIDLRVVSGERSETVPMRNRGHGKYDGEFLPWSEGEYRFSGTAAAGTDTLGKDQGLFAVEAFNIELINTRARYDILQQIAGASGGAFVTINSADSLLNKLQFSSKAVSVRIEIPLWNRASILWIIIGLLCAEWIIRKRSGML